MPAKHEEAAGAAAVAATGLDSLLETNKNALTARECCRADSAEGNSPYNVKIALANE